MIELSVVEDDATEIAPVSPTVIKIIGCGGGGSSAVNRMITAGVKDVEFIVLNTDLQALNISKADKRLAIGQKLTGGLGAGGNPEVGENAAKEDCETIQNIVQGADMVIITAGMGGGTGTGSAPVVAGIAHEAGALTIAVVTTPFDFEGRVRMANAQEGLKKLKQNVDSLIVIPNQQIMKVVDRSINYKQAFRLADDVLCQGVQGISEIITKPGAVNLDFADVKSVMKNQGDSILGVGFGEGENRAVDAAHAAISNPMLENRQIDGATKILVNITGDENVSMSEVEEIVNSIKASASKNVEVFFGLVQDDSMGDKIAVTVIATGFNNPSSQVAFGDDEEDSRKDDNVVSASDFSKLLNGGSVKSHEEESEDNAEKISSIGFNKDSLISRLEEDSNDSVEQNVEPVTPNPVHHNSVREIPQGISLNADDLSVPACWRNLNNLSRGIDLTK